MTQSPKADRHHLDNYADSDFTNKVDYTLASDELIKQVAVKVTETAVSAI